MDLYREEILEHWQNPQNWGTLKNFDLDAEVVNPLCGDEIRVQVKLDNNRSTIDDIRFAGNGCAISIASASILSENIKNKPLSQIKSLKGEDVLKTLGGRANFPPARLKCAFLALEAIRQLADKFEFLNPKS